jgi:hypothetical protein
MFSRLTTASIVTRPAAFLGSALTVTLDALAIPWLRRFRPLHHRSSSGISAFDAASPVLINLTGDTPRSSFGPSARRRAYYALG